MMMAMSNQRSMKRSGHNEWIIMTRVEASYGAHYDQPDACDNYVFLDQTQEADEIWQKLPKQQSVSVNY